MTEETDLWASEESNLWACAFAGLREALETLEMYTLKQCFSRDDHLRDPTRRDRENIRVLEDAITEVGDGLRALLAFYEWLDPDDYGKPTAHAKGLKQVKKEALNE